MNERTRLASIDPTKLDETDLQHITDGMYALMDEGEKYPSKLGRRDAIRRRCIDCNGGELSEVRFCQAIECPLWPFRMGDDPYRRIRADAKKQLAAHRHKAGEVG
jgi:hypothetical protein